MAYMHDYIFYEDLLNLFLNIHKKRFDARKVAEEQFEETSRDDWLKQHTIQRHENE